MTAYISLRPWQHHRPSSELHSAGPGRQQHCATNRVPVPIYYNIGSSSRLVRGVLEGLSIHQLWHILCTRHQTRHEWLPEQQWMYQGIAAVNDDAVQLYIVNHD